jgi:hypothetical protein
MIADFRLPIFRLLIEPEDKLSAVGNREFL